MPGRKREEGFGLILLIGITAALAILAAALVMLLTNQQWNTARERSSKTSESYAEAALNSAVVGVENDNSWLTTPFTNATEMSADYSTISGAPTVTYQVYDNLTPVNYGVNWDSNGDGEVWVQTTTTYQGRTTTVRELVQSKNRCGDPLLGGVDRHQHDADRHEQHLLRERRRHPRHVGLPLRHDDRVWRGLHLRQQR